MGPPFQLRLTSPLMECLERAPTHLLFKLLMVLTSTVISVFRSRQDLWPRFCSLLDMYVFRDGAYSSMMEGPFGRYVSWSVSFCLFLTGKFGGRRIESQRNLGTSVRRQQSVWSPVVNNSNTGAAQIPEDIFVLVVFSVTNRTLNNHTTFMKYIVHKN
jgi:hypothetical protein